MHKQVLLTLALLLLLVSTSIAALTDYHLFSSGGEYSVSAMDSNANMIIATQYTGSISLNNGQLSLASSVPDFVIFKVDRQTNNIVWHKTVEGTAEKYLTRLAVDSSDSVYVLGEYRNGNLSFGEEHEILEATTLKDTIILKLDSSGGFEWANYIQNAETLHFNSLFVNEDHGELVIAGSFSGDFVRVGTGVGGDPYRTIAWKYGQPGVTYGIKAQFASTNGIIRSQTSEETIPGTDSYNDMKDAVVFNEKHTVPHIGDRIPVNSTSSDTVPFITKTDYILETQPRFDITSGGRTEAVAMDLDSGDNLYVIVKAQTGTLNVFNNGPTVQRSVTKASSFLVKYNEGLTVQWISEISSNDGVVDATSLVVAAPDNNVYVSGSVTSSNGKTAFIAKVSSAGAVQSMQQPITGNINLIGERMGYKKGFISIAGKYSGTMSVTTTSGTTSRSASGASEGFSLQFFLDEENPVQNVCPSGVTCSYGCCNWVPPGTSTAVDQCYSNNYRCSKDLADPSKKCLCNSFNSACCNGACFNPQSYHCCPNGSLNQIGQAC